MEGYKALLFDCYGTLIDWEQGFIQGLGPISAQANSPDQRELLSIIGKFESQTQAETPTMLYPKVLETAYHRCATSLDLEDSQEAAQAFGASVGSWPAFQDSGDALGRLQALGLKLVILSNVNNESFDESRKKLETGWGSFDAVYTAENIGSYKPNLENFHYAFKHLEKDFGIKKEEILSVANSKFHDVQPAHAVGIKCAWINRANAIMGVKGLGEEPDFEFLSMDAFAKHMESL